MTRLGVYADECYPMYYFTDPDDAVFTESVLDLDPAQATRWREIAADFWAMQLAVRAMLDDARRTD